jgi:hypothetical protein
MGRFKETSGRRLLVEAVSVSAIREANDMWRFRSQTWEIFRTEMLCQLPRRMDHAASLRVRGGRNLN